MQKARRQALRLRAIALRPLVGGWSQLQCPPLLGVLPIFRSRYFFTIGRQRVLSLAGWAPRIRARFRVTGVTQVPNGRSIRAAYGTVTRCGRPFQACSATDGFCDSLPLKAARPYNPGGTCPAGLGWSPFARRY